MTIPTPFLVGPINTYLIRGETLTLIDTGPKSEEALHCLRDKLKELGLNTTDIEVVVLTHHHPDHIGLVEEFYPQAKLYAHEKVSPWLKREQVFLENTQAFYKELYSRHGVPKEIRNKIEESTQGYLSYYPDRELDDFLKEGDQLNFLSGWSVLETPGHAQSHISLYRESDGVLIAGDHLIQHISSNAIIEAPYGKGEERPKTLLQYRESLKKCLHINTAFSGHGDVITNPTELIRKRLAEQDKKAYQFKQMIGSEEISCFDLCMKKYSHIYEKQPSLTFSETLGHLDLLEDYGEIEQVEVDGKIFYKSI
nr:MBL fold metallo-hydrolase [Evansella tamaricis]